MLFPEVMKEAEPEVKEKTLKSLAMISMGPGGWVSPSAIRDDANRAQERESPGAEICKKKSSAV